MSRYISKTVYISLDSLKDLKERSDAERRSVPDLIRQYISDGLSKPAKTRETLTGMVAPDDRCRVCDTPYRLTFCGPSNCQHQS